MEISIERWQYAQKCEREFHDKVFNLETGYIRYFDTYRQYFFSVLDERNLILALT